MRKLKKDIIQNMKKTRMIEKMVTATSIFDEQVERGLEREDTNIYDFMVMMMYLGLCAYGVNENKEELKELMGEIKGTLEEEVRMVMRCVPEYRVNA
ncbi:MAG: hypothetical protein JXC33_07920 [Deltaproteobacteria bacterium]|nr:hypothetical protein [Deltaproteobacteria bacterium]